MAIPIPPSSFNGVLKQLRFAFPFRKKGEGKAASSAEFRDEHDFFTALQRESGGAYPVSRQGMWHGGIHITEAGSGAVLDLNAGVRCLANGVVVAWRRNLTYLVSEVAAEGGEPAFSGLYSTGFTLVRHLMEFPRGTTLTFFTLYMHLQDIAGYDSDPLQERPAYWSTPNLETDCVIVPSTPIPIKAGDLIGHLGRYDSLSQRTSSRMVHIEVFCDDSIKSFMEKGVAWVEQNGAHPHRWEELGLPSEPTILRVGKNTKLFRMPYQEGKNASKTSVVQVYKIDQKAQDEKNRCGETVAGTDGLKLDWYTVEGADARYKNISGWVRAQNFAGGRVTREFEQKWVDFKILEEPHDATHTMSESATAYVDYASDADVPESGALGKLSPLMKSVYQALYPTGDGSTAADNLCAAVENPWIAMRMSRLIVKHESEWANPGKWKPLFTAIEEHTGVQAHHEAEQKRIDKLVWWEEIKAKFPDLPEPNVFHIHPIGLVGNFVKRQFKLTLAMMLYVFPLAVHAELQGVMNELNAHLTFYKLDTGHRRCHFFAQVLQEVGRELLIRSESLNYSSTALTSGLFSYFVAHPHEAQLYGRTSQHPANQEAIANRAYATRDENGNIASADGYRYRGRGMIQLTHRGGYRRFTHWNRVNKTQWPDDLDMDFLNNPDAVGQVKYAVRSACYFWVVNNLYSLADGGIKDTVVDRISKIINPGLFRGSSNDAKMKSINARRTQCHNIDAWEGLK